MASKGIPVYWLMGGTGEIHSDILVGVEGDRAIFEDKSWNPVEACFLTEDQCRRYHGLPTPETESIRKAVCDKLEKLLEELRKDPPA